MSEDESRANRLRDRRRRSRGRAQQEQEQEQDQKPAENESDETGETDKPSEPSKPSKTSEQSQPSKSNDGGGGGGVKAEQVGTYMYLPEPLVEELAYQFKLVSAEYERKLGGEFEKNRHWYPLVISLGLEQAEDLDPEEIADHLSSLSDAS